MTTHVRIPMDRVAVLIGPKGEVKAYTPDDERLELATLRPGAIIGEQSFDSVTPVRVASSTQAAR